MQLRSKITVARNIRIHHHSLLNAKRKMQLFSVADGMVKTTFEQLEKRFNSVYMASNFYLSIRTCWNTELQQVQVNQCPDDFRTDDELQQVQVNQCPDDFRTDSP